MSMTNCSTLMAAPQHVRIFVGEPVAQRWLLPQLVEFKAAFPDITVELETRPARRGMCVDLQIASRPDSAPPADDPVHTHTLFSESLVPVCSPALLESRGRPTRPAEVAAWPLLSWLGGGADWPEWFARQRLPVPDLAAAWRFRLYGMVVRAAVEGMGAAVGHTTLLASELEEGKLVPMVLEQRALGVRYCLIADAEARRRPAVQAVHEWLHGPTQS